jgi:hypothetical protein
MLKKIFIASPFHRRYFTRRIQRLSRQLGPWTRLFPGLRSPSLKGRME